jgi:glutamate formiminotransferase
LTQTTLLAVPNVSEGSDSEPITKISRAFQDQEGVRLLDVHTDADHHRSVFTLAGSPGSLSGGVVAGARQAVASIELGQHRGAHPRVGAIDVAPIVYLRDEDRGAACAEALVLGDRLGTEARLPVFLYGVLGGGRTRAELRRGGLPALTQRLVSGELRADFGPGRPHPTAGAVLVAARPPLVAFNVELAPPAALEDARKIAALIREGGAEGLPGVRAIGVWLGRREVAQVSMNVEDHQAAPLARVVQAIERHARPSQAELVGLVPRAALKSFPERLPLRGAATIEDALDRAPDRDPETD